MDLEEKDILKRLLKNDALFKKIHVVTQRYDILPNDKDHLGAFVEYQDISELRDDFVEELSDTIVDWIYSSEKFTELKNKLMSKGKSESAATREIGRLTQEKFRAIFGHSLDVTDKDILARLILKDGAKTTIFYHNKKALESQIANLVKVIGQDELIARVHGEDATIEFVEQQE